MESLLPRTRVESRGGGDSDVVEGTTGSLRAADEWAAMSHRIDAAAACPAHPARPAPARLREASLPAGPAAYLIAHF